MLTVGNKMSKQKKPKQKFIRGKHIYLWKKNYKYKFSPVAVQYIHWCPPPPAARSLCGTVDDSKWCLHTKNQVPGVVHWAWPSMCIQKRRDFPIWTSRDYLKRVVHAPQPATSNLHLSFYESAQSIFIHITLYNMEQSNLILKKRIEINNKHRLPYFEL